MKHKVGDRITFHHWGQLRHGTIEAITYGTISVPSYGSDAWLWPYFWLSETDIQENHSQRGKS